MNKRTAISTQFALIEHPERDKLRGPRTEGGPMSSPDCLGVQALLSAPWPEDKAAIRILDEIPQLKNWRDFDFVILI